MKERSIHVVTFENHEAIVDLLLQEEEDRLGVSEFFNFPSLQEKRRLLQDCYEGPTEHQNNVEWVDEVAEFFNSNRRTFLDIPGWTFSVFESDFGSTGYGEKIMFEIFQTYEKKMEIDDSCHEEKEFIKSHFNGDPIKYIEAGGWRCMKRWKEENSLVDFGESRDQF
jgi:hypothetical protein